MEGRSAIKTARAKWRDLSLRSWYTARGNLNFHLKVVHSEITFKLHPIEFDIWDNSVRMEEHYRSHKHYTNQNNKLTRLREEKAAISNNRQPLTSPKEHKFYNKFVDLSATFFEEEELNMLNKGVNFAPPLNITDKVMEDLATDTEAAINNQPLHLKAACAHHIQQNIGKKNNRSSTPVPTNIIRNIRAKLVENNLIACKADKGNTITILYKTDYNSKIADFINDSKAVALSKDPTNSFKSQVINCVKNCSKLTNGQSWKYVPMNPSAPLLYGLPKLHKENIPIRPIVSYTPAPAYHLCVLFNNQFVQSTNFISPNSVKNSIDLVNKIGNLAISSNSKLVSFDVSSLFTSIPLTILKTRVFSIIDSRVVDLVTRIELKRMFNVCINQNYFCYENIYYTFSDGLPMGSPLSPLLAEIFMSWFEEKIMSPTNPYTHNIKFWYRYVDDILCLWSGTDRQLDSFLNWLNNQHNTINFTVEKEVNHSINFLDITITRLDSHFSFSIYRKPTYSDAIIPMSSTHPLNVKLSAFHSFIERLINIPMSKYHYETEVNIILQIAVNNGYSPKIVHRILKNKVRTKILKSIFPQQPKPNKQWRRLRFIGQASYKIGKLISKHSDINIGYYNNSTVKKLIFNNKTKTNPLSKPGVYRIGCSDCDCTYIGQTGRNFITRAKEHLRISENSKSALGLHLISENHSSSIDNLEVLHLQPKGKKLDALETLEIRRALHSNQNILNDQTELKYSPLTDPALLYHKIKNTQTNI